MNNIIVSLSQATKPVCVPNKVKSWKSLKNIEIAPLSDCCANCSKWSSVGWLWHKQPGVLPVEASLLNLTGVIDCVWMRIRFQRIAQDPVGLSTSTLWCHMCFFPLSPSLSLLPQMEVSGIWCVLFLHITFHRVSRGQRSRWLGGGGEEQISPELNVIYEYIFPSVSPSWSQTAKFYRHLKTYKKIMIHQICISSNFECIFLKLWGIALILHTICWSV